MTSSTNAAASVWPKQAGGVGWTPARDLGTREWAAAGRKLGAVGRCVQWLLGDWIAYGNARFGERYARASKITGYDPQTLMNMVYVASRFPISRRRERLSWSHHEALSALDAEEQDRWLDQAESCRWSVSDLRTALRARHRANSNRRLVKEADDVEEAPEMVSGAGKAPALICPQCHQQVPLTPSALATIRADDRV